MTDDENAEVWSVNDFLKPQPGNTTIAFQVPSGGHAGLLRFVAEEYGKATTVYFISQAMTEDGEPAVNENGDPVMVVVWPSNEEEEVLASQA